MQKEIKDIIKSINNHKKLVLDFYILQSEVSSMEENAYYYYQCEYNMDICKDLINSLYDALATIDIIDSEEIENYLLNNFNFKIFNTQFIWGYME